MFMYTYFMLDASLPCQSAYGLPTDAIIIQDALCVLGTKASEARYHK